MANLTFYAGTPASTDKMWCAEMASVEPWCVGRGVDPGAGTRTFSDDTVRVDLFPEYEPHHVGSATALPFPSDSFDYVVSSHLLEHLPDPRRALMEWYRVAKQGGHVCTIVPNTIYTRGQNTDRTPHLHEWTPQSLCEEVLGISCANQAWTDVLNNGEVALDWIDGRLAAFAEACPRWSLMFVIKVGE